MEGGALSDDDDFQDGSTFTRRKAAAASERVHLEGAKVCLATGVRTHSDPTLNKYLSFIPFFFFFSSLTREHVIGMHEHSVRKTAYLSFS